ncbi:DUF6894 family protein [Bradyrhizobium sp. Arg816]|uniref:DUF6894 family protein n=1 Tax=Bradyrhizobium sp. Arg816 TaxID=2998491 RepID=UPI00249F5C6B|nr:hypothetical protein [Bradyrhizobium sp. Arg816]
MKRYYFDIRDGDGLSVDEEGMTLPDLVATQEEAARSLVDIIRNTPRGKDSRAPLAIDVRDDNGPPCIASFHRVLPADAEAVRPPQLAASY